MNSLFRFFFDLILLRRTPQELPASSTLLGLMLVVNLLVGTAGTLDNFGGILPSLSANLLDICVILGLLYVALVLVSHRARFVQTATAILGVGTLFGIIVLILVLLMGGDRVPGEIIGLSNLVLLIWLHVALGHVLRHALEVTLGKGIFAAVGFSMAGLFVVSLAFRMIV